MRLRPGAWILLCQLISSQTDSFLGRVDPDRAVSFTAQAQDTVNDDRLAFEMASKWLQTHEDKFGDGISLWEFLGNLATEEMHGIRTTIVSEYLANIRRVFASHNWFDRNREAEIKRMTEEAVSKFRGKVEGLDKDLRNVITEAMLRLQVYKLRFALASAISDIQYTQRFHIQIDFMDAVKARSQEISRQARNDVDRLSCWSSRREAMYLRVFSRDAGYDELPDEIQSEVGAKYKEEERGLQASIHEVFTTTREDIWVPTVYAAVAALLGLIVFRAFRARFRKDAHF
jgi:hypothetical protein